MVNRALRSLRELILLDNLNPPPESAGSSRSFSSDRTSISTSSVTYPVGLSCLRTVYLLLCSRQGKTCSFAGSIIDKPPIGTPPAHRFSPRGYNPLSARFPLPRYRFFRPPCSHRFRLQNRHLWRSFGNACFGNPISAPLQPSCFRRTVCACRQRRDHLANRTAAFRSRQARDRKDRACKRFFRQRVPLYDSDFSVYPVVCKTNVARRAHRHRHCLRRIDGNLAARRRADFPHDSRQPEGYQRAVPSAPVVCVAALSRAFISSNDAPESIAPQSVIADFLHANSAIRLFQTRATSLHFGRQAVLQ